MKRVFFPHTMITPVLAEALQAALGPMTLYHPLPEAVDAQTAKLAEAQQIELAFPCPEDGGRLVAAIASFRSWAAAHGGRDLAGLMGRGAEPPFFGADATSRIVAEIKSGHRAPTAETTTERLHRSRLLLMLAQELDARRSELTADWRSLEAQERRMLEELKGEDKAVTGGIGAVAPSAAPAPLHMLTARIGAWAQLALQSEDWGGTSPAALFLTDSAEVLDYVTELSAADPLLSRHPVSAASERLRAWLADPQGSPPMTATPPPATPALHLTLVRLPGMDTPGWLRRLAGLSSTDIPGPDRHATAEGVFVGSVALA